MTRVLLAVLIFLFFILVYYRSWVQDSLGSTSREESTIRKYPLNGVLDRSDECVIYYPKIFWSKDKLGTPLLEGPKKFISFFQDRLTWIDELTIAPNSTILERSRNLYIEMLISMLSATSFSSAEFSVQPELRKKKLTVSAFDSNKRATGLDWTYIGDTMVGRARLLNIWKLLSDVILNNVEGDFIETGVWRGGSSILARGIIGAFDSNRNSYVCDSFHGLPPGTRQMNKADIGWDETPYLEVSDQIVASSFHRYSLMSENIIFAKGFFNATMPLIRKLNVTFSVMRLDGDLYESTVDVLYNLYDKLSVGGFIIMDDWFGFPSRTAVEDFHAVHQIELKVEPIDSISVYFKKETNVTVQYWRYLENKFK